jgi:hypothetical protein
VRAHFQTAERLGLRAVFRGVLHVRQQ